MAQANAVETRILLDLRIGSAFTRLQTLNLQNRHEALKRELISYGMYSLTLTYDIPLRMFTTSTQVRVNSPPLDLSSPGTTNSRTSNLSRSGISICR